MEVLKIVKEVDLKKIVDRLKLGHVGVILSDTVYGLSCLVSNKLGIKYIYNLKKRALNKPFLILVSDFSMLKKYFSFNLEQENILKTYWLNDKIYPTTFILSAKNNLIKLLNINKKQGVAVRLPKNKFLIKIIKSLDEPIISTSCNISGQPNVNNFKEIISLFNFQSSQPDFIVKFKNIRPKRRSSQILDIRDNSIKQIRF
ncbi:MAG TPA: L-threonylcarbamoyladenylate synthase [bacterium]|nr:L-threonylcarbamoyladenylate synthase [bacterium]